MYGKSVGGRSSTPTKKRSPKAPAWEGLVKPPESKPNLRPSSSQPLLSGELLGYSMNSSVNYAGVDDINDLMRGTNAMNLSGGQQRLDSSFAETMDSRPKSLLAPKSSGPDFPSLPPDIQTDITSGKYVDFMAILSRTMSFTGFPKQMKETLRKDILVWLDCYAVYTSVMARAHPTRIVELLNYQRVILWVYRESQDPETWWRYDIGFRRKASWDASANWNSVDEELYTLASSVRFRTAQSCELCLTNIHPVHKCPFAPNKLSKSGQTIEDGSQTITRNENIENALINPEKSGIMPKEGLELKFAFGYHGFNACNNLFYTQSNEIVFHTAGLGIIYSQRTHEQRFYNGHDDDILCLTTHDTEDYVATGQVGKAPSTHVWDASSMKTVAILKGFHRRGIICVDFSGDGTKIADVGLDDDHTICVWDWRKQEKIAAIRGHKDTIYNLEWNPYDVNHFATVGVKHIKFWTLSGKKIDKRTATFGKAGELSDMLCICHSPYEDTCFAGGGSGDVYIWQGTTYRKSVQAHKGAVYALFAILQSNEKGFVSGGKDGVVVIWDEFFSQPLRAFQIETSRFPAGTILLQDCPPVRSIHTDEGRILVGTGHDDIIQIHADGTMEVVLQGHGEGELWGLAAHPSKLECATVSDDKTLRIWNLKDHRMKRVALMKKGGRCLDYHPTGETIAVGLNDGSFTVVDSKSLKTLLHIQNRVEEISDIKYSPDGRYLGVASHDNVLDIYNMKRGKRRAVCKGNSSYLTHFDWDSKGHLIQTNSGAKEHLLFESPSGKRKVMSHEAIVRADWATFTCVLGPTVRGVFPPMSDVTDVNTACRTKDYSLVATGDDFGKVKIFNYPVLQQKGAKFRAYRGHCSHVTNVRWTADDKSLLTIGGADASLLVWERTPIVDYEQGKIGEPQKLVQPKFIPTGPIKSSIVKGKPAWT